MESMNLTDHFLIAMPGLTDPNFYRTVTYVCAHNEEGAMGIIINRPMNVGLGEVLSQMNLVPADPDINDIIIYHGGPVQQDRGFVIHTPASQWDSTIDVGNRFGLATSRDILEAISRGEGPGRSLVALGYAGWGAGQLESEMLENAWLCGPADASIMFDVACENRWQEAVSLLGVDIDNLSHEAGHA